MSQKDASHEETNFSHSFNDSRQFYVPSRNSPGWEIKKVGDAIPYSEIPTIKDTKTESTFVFERMRFIFEVVAVVVAVVTTIFFWKQIQDQAIQSEKQNQLVQQQIQDQATQSAEENLLIRQQINQQQEIYRTTQRAQLLETIYGRRDCENDDIEECPFVSSVRVRAEAAKAFTELEKEVGINPDLSNINLSGANLQDTNIFTDTILSNAVLSGTVLSGANLSGANLGGANLHEARLDEANLSGANLSGANLSGANLHEARLHEADLSGANLSGTILSGVDLSGAVHTFETRWPEDFDPLQATGTRFMPPF